MPGKDSRTEKLAAVFARLLAVPELAFRDVRSLLLSGSRPQLMHKMSLGVGLLSRLGGRRAVEDTVVAIRDVGCWWPSPSAGRFA